MNSIDRQDSPEIRTMRNMAWRRAVGELMAMLDTYWEEGKKHKRAHKVIEEFINEIQSEGLQE